MTLVAIETARRRLVPVSCLRVYRRDHAVLRHPVDDAKDAVLSLLDVLPHDRRQQRRCLLQLRQHAPVVERRQQRIRVSCQRVQQRFTGRSVVPITYRLSCCAVVVVPA